ncbi:hypothetical protein [Variovorax sp. UC122_21]|uniref:hypothetical protein n=1 Tax=Variovorax TaxID=34072 RepID=UPI001932B02D|nr:hypothetical protein INQ48_17970 [Variovorax paradoxus]
MSFKEINDRFGLQFQRGSRVFCDGRLGTITGATHSHIRVRFDGRQNGAPCDPLEVRLVDTMPVGVPAMPAPQALASGQ